MSDPFSSLTMRSKNRNKGDNEIDLPNLLTINGTGGWLLRNQRILRLESKNQYDHLIEIFQSVIQLFCLDHSIV